MNAGAKRGLVVVSAAAVAVLALILVHGRDDAHLRITVAGTVAHVRTGTTLSEAAGLLGLDPQAGSLLGVDGEVLRPGAFAGTLLLNGRPARGETPLHEGDRIARRAGADRREPLEREVVPVPEGSPSDPQYMLARTPGRQIVTRGAVSHKLVSAVFRPSGSPVVVERAVALTFDDGPSPRFTPRILATLRKLDAPATFFGVGYLAERYPALIDRERRAGMTIGNHSYNHPEVPPFDELPLRLLEDEIMLGAQSLGRLGVRPRLFRPPGGRSSPAVVRAAEALGERVVLWSVDPGDWRPGVRPREIVRRVLRSVRPGSIVILHDGGGDRSATVAALPAIVRGIRSRGLRLVAIPSQMRRVAVRRRSTARSDR